MTADVTTTPLRVVSFNLRYGTAEDGGHAWLARRRAAAELMAGLDVGVCGMQEVLPEQRAYLEPRLPGLRWFGVGRSDGRQGGEQSPIAVHPDRLTVERWETRWLSQRPQVAGSRGWDARVPRIATVLYGVRAGRRVGVVNTHFDHRGSTAQRESARLIADLIRSDDTRAWVVLGDFNVTIDTEPMQRLLAAGLRSVLPADAGGTFHAFSGATDRQRIDHILIDPGWDVVAADIVYERPGGVLSSDHWPVRADLRLR